MRPPEKVEKWIAYKKQGQFLKNKVQGFEKKRIKHQYQYHTSHQENQFFRQNTQYLEPKLWEWIDILGQGLLN